MLNGFNLPDAELDRLSAQIIDADHEHGPAVRLELPRCWPNKDQGTLLPRDQSGLPIPHVFRITEAEPDQR